MREYVRKPYVIDTIVVSVEPITEKNPLIAQPHATYSLLCSASVATSEMASGMNMPRQNPSGAHSAMTTIDLGRQRPAEQRLLDHRG